MDIKAIISDLVAKFTKDPSLLSNFTSDPVKTIEGLIGTDLPDEQINSVIEGVKEKVNLDGILGEGSIGDKIKDVVGNAGSIGDTIKDAIGGAADDAQDAAKDAGDSIGDTIKDAIGGIGEKLGGLFKKD